MVAETWCDTGCDPTPPQQLWLTKRLDGLIASDFVASVRFLCTSNITPPKALEDIWYTCKSPGVAAALQEEALLPFGTEEVVLVMCDPGEEDQIDMVTQILATMDRLDDDAPAALFLPHTVETQDVEKPNMKTLVANIVELGLRDFVVGEPCGFDLAITVRSKIEVMAAIRARVFNDLMLRREFLHEVSSTQQRTSRLLWEYLRVRLDTCIPAVDASLESGPRPQIPGYTLGRFLGEGSFGKVYSLTDARGGREAVKIIRKKGMRQFNDVLQVNRMIKVMNKLREEQWNHPGIAHLRHVYHSPSYFFFRMEFGGRENLLQRVQRRDQGGVRAAPLSCAAVNAIIRQAANVVVHLHTGPKVYHRDINPANFVVMEAGDGILLKLVDFEFAVVHDGRSQNCSRCGTLPFIAPEVFLDDACDWFAADIWSLGMTILEVNSKEHVFETILNLTAADFRQQAAVATSQTARRAFEKPGSASATIKDMCREELKPLLPFVDLLASGMLNTRWEQRVTASVLSQTLASNQRIASS